jgi:hypothetical protein
LYKTVTVVEHLNKIVTVVVHFNKTVTTGESVAKQS